MRKIITLLITKCNMILWTGIQDWRNTNDTDSNEKRTNI